MRPDFWSGRRVLVTGHTGFKGAWLSAWLDLLGAEVTGLALAPETEPALWPLLGLAAVRDLRGDITDAAALDAALRTEPEVVFHLAAQSLVGRSYREPVQTFASNVLGVVSLLHAISRTPSVRAVVVVTSDKCYENPEANLPFHEDDRLGGRDPYSASKGCAEIATASMRQSFFLPDAPGGHPARIATARGGNVVGGGDWSEGRLVPDIVRGCLGAEGTVSLRAPDSIRPWQHVLELLRGYLTLAERLCDGMGGAASAWNFGPDRASERSVAELAQGMVRALGHGSARSVPDPQAPHEARVLRLDAGRAARELGWRPLLDFEATVALTARWYAGWAEGVDAAHLTRSQIGDYMALFALSRVA